MRHGSLFSGIGGFDLAAEWMGWENVFHCEINPFCQQVLKYHFPNAITHENITETDFTIYAGRIDVLSGGFPCQPFSAAGKRKGTEDERHLWPQMLRAIKEIAPRYIVGENVFGLLNWNAGMVFEQVCIDLEREGYQVATVVIPAAAVNAPHGRDRVWFIAQNTLHSGCVQREFSEEGASVWKQRNAGTGNSERICGAEMAGLTADTESQSSERLRPEQRKFSQSQQKKIGRNGGKMGYGLTADTSSRERQGRKQHRSVEKTRTAQTNRRQFSRPVRPDWTQFPTQPPVCGGNDGLSRELDGITFSKWRNESIKAYGNAVVPQVVYNIFKSIQCVEESHIQQQ